jgi:NADPH-dependent 2,4-dienoyl-CoA reductase/sulfur reductase-like enzyme
MTDRIVVVGGGIAGLAAAAALAGGADVRVVERLPAPGGTWEFDHPMVKRLVGECIRRGVVLECGDTALRWRDRRLLVIGPGHRAWLEADHLVFAGGTRPATPAELPVLGSRPAGLFVATVAHHLLEGRVHLGRRIAMCGSGYWVDLVLRDLPSGTDVTLVSDGTAPRPPAGVSVTLLSGHRPLEVLGHDRVEGLVVESVGRAHPERTTLPCDAVVLGGDLRPLRNVDGAVVDAPDVTYVQHTAAVLTAQDVIDHAETAVAGLMTKEAIS